jgi:uncharacterized membrane protein
MGFTLLEVSVSLAILLPAILLLVTFLTKWENRISRTAFSAELPFIICAAENYLCEFASSDLSAPISMRLGHDGEVEIMSANAGSVNISFAPLGNLPIAQCNISGRNEQLSIICPCR